MSAEEGEKAAIEMHGVEYQKCVKKFPKLDTHTWEVVDYYTLHESGVLEKLLFVCKKCKMKSYSNIYPTQNISCFYVNDRCLSFVNNAFYKMQGCGETIMKKALE